MADARRVVRLLALAAALACARGDDQPAERGGATVSSLAASERDPLLAQADSLYLDGDVSGARAIWEPMLAEAERRGDSAGMALHLTSLGLAARKRSEFGRAKALLQRSLALKERLGMRAELFRSLNALGLVAQQEGRLQEASAFWERAARAARAVGDSVSESKALGNMGLVLRDLGDYERARVGFARQRDVAVAVADTISAARALNNIGMLDALLGDPLAAIASLAEARRFYRAIGDGEGEENALAQLALAYDALGEPQRALALLDSAIDQARRQGLRTQESEDLKLLADLYLDAGQYRQALVHYERARQINREIGFTRQEGEALRDEARVRAALGQAQLAHERANEALRVHRAGGFRVAQLDDLLLLAELAQQEGNIDEARAHVRSAEAIAETLRIDVVRTRAALGAARLADAAGDAARVLAVLDPTRAPIAGTDLRTEWEVHALRGRAYASLGQLDAAAAAGRRAVAALERVRGGYASGVLRTSFTTTRIRAYADLLLVLLRLGREEEALAVADAARGRALLEHLSDAREDLAQGASADNLVTRERLLRRIDQLARTLRTIEERPREERSTDDPVRSRAIADRLAETRSEYESLLMRASGDGGRTAVLGAGEVDVVAVRGALTPGEALLEYFVAPDRVLIFVATRERVRSFVAVGSAQELAGRVRLARELLGRRGMPPDAAREVLSALHAMLIRPALDSGALDGVQRLVLVPHGTLSYLPFAALIDERTGEHLVRRFSTLVLPNAATLSALRARESGAGIPASRAVALAPFPGLLPATQREAARVRRSLGRGAEALLHSRATEGALREALAEGAVVHVATHGVMNARNPMFSRIELAASPERRSMDDGRLEVHELLGMRVRSPLVFLSGCETGLGSAWSTHFERGEDLATLAQAFLFAGARDVVGTLWRIEDDRAATFAEHFYRALRRLAPPEALADAQRTMLDDPVDHAPYHWAGYQLHGAGGMQATAQKGAVASVYQR